MPIDRDVTNPTAITDFLYCTDQQPYGRKENHWCEPQETPTTNQRKRTKGDCFLSKLTEKVNAIGMN